MNPLLLWLQLAVTSLPAAASPSADITATRYDTRTTFEADEKMPPMPQSESRMRVTRAAGKTRMDSIAVDSAGEIKGLSGSYRLAFDDGRFYTVDPVRREYSQMDFAKVQGALSTTLAMLKQLNMRFGDSKFETEDLGPAEKVQGYATRHWRLKSSMTMTAALASDTMTFSLENVTDSWYAPEVEALSFPVGASLDSLGLSMGPFGPEEMQKYTAAYAKLPKAMPIRSVTRTSASMAEFDISSAITTEVTDIHKVKVSADFFDIPKGYELVEMKLPRMPMIPPAGQ